MSPFHGFAPPLPGGERAKRKDYGYGLLSAVIILDGMVFGNG